MTTGRSETSAEPPLRPGRRSARLYAGFASILVHVALLAVMSSGLRPEEPRLAEERPSLVVSLHDGLALTAPPAEAAPAPEAAIEPPPSTPEPESEAPPPPLESVLVDFTLPPIDLTSDPEPVGEVAASGASLALAAAAASGTTCDLTEALRSVLQQDGRVRESLARLPRDARSVANALMLWDGRWTDRAGGEVGDLSAVRSAIVRLVRTAPEPCQQELQRGPRLIPIVSGADTTLLAVGSGVWSWAQTLEGPQTD
jgi:hypothetical protein